MNPELEINVACQCGLIFTKPALWKEHLYRCKKLRTALESQPWSDNGRPEQVANYRGSDPITINYRGLYPVSQHNTLSRAGVSVVELPREVWLGRKKPHHVSIYENWHTYIWAVFVCSYGRGDDTVDALVRLKDDRDLQRAFVALVGSVDKKDYSDVVAAFAKGEE